MNKAEQRTAIIAKVDQLLDRAHDISDIDEIQCFLHINGVKHATNEYGTMRIEHCGYEPLWLTNGD